MMRPPEGYSSAPADPIDVATDLDHRTLVSEVMVVAVEGAGLSVVVVARIDCGRVGILLDPDDLAAINEAARVAALAMARRSDA